MPVKFNTKLTKDYPADGVVHVWAMDDYIARPFEVIERGKGKPEPVEKVPPGQAADRHSGTDLACDYSHGLEVLDTDAV
jgi:hypothetical protein